MHIHCIHVMLEIKIHYYVGSVLVPMEMVRHSPVVGGEATFQKDCNRSSNGGMHLFSISL